MRFRIPNTSLSPDSLALATGTPIELNGGYSLMTVLNLKFESHRNSRSMEVSYHIIDSTCRSLSTFLSLRTTAGTHLSVPAWSGWSINREKDTAAVHINGFDFGIFFIPNPI